jgi:demethylmenaquinone methyltransferase/2-methoxy-6-polyprenyl-1,4-benzoquinol methylase
MHSTRSVDAQSFGEPGQHAHRVRTMFGRIVPRYDLLNRLMSVGMDRRWRRLAAAAAEPRGALALDVGTGTGDLALELRRQGATRIVGVDFSAGMLAAGSCKAAAAGADVSWALADALRLPFPDAAFDCVTSAFLLRNLADLRACLAEMARVLRPGGRLVCLDITQLPQGAFGALYRLYFNRLLPPLAGTISGDRAAYRYLPGSLRGFPDACSLSSLLADLGLVEARARRLGAGTVALHTARKST